MNTSLTTAKTASPAHPMPLAQSVKKATGLLERIPHSLVALLARFSIAAVFWTSGQAKIQGLAINFVTGDFKLGWPRLSPRPGQAVGRPLACQAPQRRAVEPWPQDAVLQSLKSGQGLDSASGFAGDPD